MHSFNWSNRKVLVTGAGGFIGSHLCEDLVAAGAKVTALLHYDTRADHENLEYLPKKIKSEIEVVLGDICDPFLVHRLVAGQDTVFHLAALIAIPYSYQAPQSYVKTNVEGTLNLLEACRTHGTRRMVHTSTSEVYGTALYTPIDEKHPLQGQSPYSASKIAADKMAESYFCAFDLPVTTLRPFNTYGPRQSARAVLPTMITQCLGSGSEVQLGDLTPVRDMNFVKDTSSAFLAVAQTDSCIGKVFNTGTGKGVTVGEMLDLVMKLTGSQKKVVSDPKRIRPSKSEVFKLISNSNPLREVTGWEPRYSLEDGLKETIEFVRSHLDRFRVGEYAI